MMLEKNVSSKSGARKTSSAKTVGFSDPAIGKEVVPAQPPPGNYGSLEGDWGAGDLKIARLDLKHAVDSRFTDVTPGHYVYSRSAEDYLPLAPPFRVIFLKARKGYLQNVEQGEIPLICYTKQELAELGGTLDRGRPDLTLFAPFCDCLILIDQEARSEWPDTPLLDVGGKKKALATYRAKTSAFKEIGSVLASWDSYQRIAKKEPEPLWVQEWNLSSALRKLPSFTYWVPTLQRSSVVTEGQAGALRELVENL
jgi:hypothetical protein